MINKVNKKDVIEAMEYFFVEGFIDELTTDKKYYTKILLNNAANQYGIKLEWEGKWIARNVIMNGLVYI